MLGPKIIIKMKIKQCAIHIEKDCFDRIPL
jgi:hypothetical protein